MSKKRGDVQQVGDAIRDLLNAYRLRGRFDQASIVDSWERLVGKPIAKKTTKVFVRNKILFVQFDSPSIKHDFSLHKSEVLQIFQKEFGAEMLTEIIVI